MYKIKKAMSIFISASILAQAGTVFATDTQNPELFTDPKHNSKLTLTHSEAAQHKEMTDGITNITEISPRSDSGYSEIIYIETVDDLISLDGHTGGYYELKNDIDISSTEWESIELNDATINGAGYTISGLTINSMPSDTEDGDTYIGLIQGWGNYITDLNLANTVIDFTISPPSSDYLNFHIAPLGNVYADNCRIEAAINVDNPAGTDNNIQLYIYGIAGGNNSVFSGDINTINGNVYGIYGISSGCSFYGDINSYGSYNRIYGIFSNEGADSCTVYGNIEAMDSDGYFYATAAGISGDANGCAVYGDISAEGSAYGCFSETVDLEPVNCKIKGNIHSENGNAAGIFSWDGGASGCAVEGDITAINSDAYGIYGDTSSCTLDGDVISSDAQYASSYGIYVNGNSNGCTVKGDIISDSGAAYGICGESSADGCAIYGDISGYSSSAGITGSGKYSSCNIYGNISSNGSSSYGIDVYGSAEKCTVFGNISTLQNAYNEVSIAGGISGAADSCIIAGNIESPYHAIGVRDASNSSIIGNINGTAIDSGIENSSNCYISGEITENYNENTALTVSSSDPYKAYYKCYSCGDSFISDQDYGESYECGCNYWSNYTRLNELYYELGQHSSPGTDTTPAPAATLPPLGAYTIMVIDTETSKPMAGAELDLDGKKYTTDENGTAVINQDCIIGGLNVQMGGEIIYTETNYTAVPGQINIIYVNGLDLETDDFNFGNSLGTTVRGPELELMGKKFPLFEQPINFDFNYFDTVNVAYDKDREEYQVIIGSAYDKESIQENDATNPTWRKNFEEISNFYNNVSQQGFTDDLIKSFNATEMASSPKLGRMLVDGSISLAGFIKLYPENGDIQADGGLIIASEGSASSSIPWPVCPALYASFQISGTLGTSLSLVMTNKSIKDPLFSTTGNITGALTPSVGIGAGLKGVLSVETGLEGSLETSIDFPLEKLEESLKISITGGYYAACYCLGREFRTSDTLAGLQLYPYIGEISLSEYNESDFKWVDRSYINNTDNEDYNSNSFNKSVYPYTNVETVALSDGRILMVWLDDDPMRGNADRTAIYYSICDNGIWSEAQQINNDGTADFEFHISSYGNTAAIVWQNAGRLIQENESLDETARALELSYSVFDGVYWGEPVSVTSDNDNFEYAPNIYFEGYDIYITWTQNTANTAIAESTDIENIYKVKYSDGTLQEYAEIYTSLPVGSISAVGQNGLVSVASINDLGITELYIDDKEIYETSENISGLHYNNGVFYFSENGKLKNFDQNGKIVVLCDNIGVNPQIISNNMNYAAIFEVHNGYTTDLYISYQKDSEWTFPVPIMQLNKKLRSWSAVMDNNGNVSIAAAATQISTNNEDTANDVNLIYTSADPVEDIEVTKIIAKNTISPSHNAEFSVSLTNRTKSTIKNIYVTLSGDKSGELFSGPAAANIKAGENGTVDVRVSIPDDFTKQNITAYVTSDIYELNTDNNAAHGMFGLCDLSVGLNDNCIDSTGYANVTVENSGCETANNVGMQLICGDEIIHDQIIGTLNPGEKTRVKIDVSDADLSLGLNVNVSSSGDEQYYYNNSDYYKPEKEKSVASIQYPVVSLAPGQTYNPEINIYPISDIHIYAVSSDETVAKVDENGNITAISYGSAIISYISPDLETTPKLTVNVREMGIPKIISSDFIDKSDEYMIYGELDINIDVSSCLSEGETETMIAAVYDISGNLIGIHTMPVISSDEYNINMIVYEHKPAKVKIMLWQSIQSAFPSSQAAEIYL